MRIKQEEARHLGIMQEAEQVARSAVLLREIAQGSQKLLAELEEELDDDAEVLAATTANTPASAASAEGETSAILSWG